jgi:hypothetical protein
MLKITPRNIVMKTFTIAAALGAALIASAAAYAADAPQKSGSGHYEWRQVPQFGPKAPLTAPQRVWVPDNARTADCDCDMMKMSAADCMMDMHRPKVPSAG